jgi:hypothetical protein
MLETTEKEVQILEVLQASNRGGKIIPMRAKGEQMMELLHHQPQLREDDGEYVCSRCGLINPGDDDACIPVNLEPADSKGGAKPKAA